MNDFNNAFIKFKKQNPTYYKEINEYIEFLHSAYTLVCGTRFSKISRTDEISEFVYRLAFGMLLRHAVEATTASLANEIGVDAGSKTVDQRLDALKGHSAFGYNSRSEKALYIAKGYANEVAHPQLLNSGYSSFSEMENFYFNRLEPVLDAHIKSVRRSKRKDINRYLIKIKDQLDNFSIKNKITYGLLRCCLVRQLTECAVNIWCYRENIVPTDSLDAATDSLHTKLVELSYTQDKKVINNLFTLKNTSNRLMHIYVFKISNIYKLSAEITRLHSVVEAECAPDAKKTKPGKPAVIATLLCGFTGWLGTHHFYSGNKIKGFAFLLSGGLIICPIISLNKIRRGEFHSKKWGKFPKHPLITFLSVLFMVLHLCLYIFIFIMLFQKQ